VFADQLICPLCRAPLSGSPQGLRCACWRRAYPVVDGIPDLFVSIDDQDAIDGPNQTWLDPRVVEARNTVYRLCARELKGMQFCVQEIGQRTYHGCCAS
jgi:hypothetical protein